MSVPVYTRLPRLMASGDTIKFLITDTRFPSGTWTLEFIIQTATPITVTAAADHTVTVGSGDIPADASGIHPCYFRYTSGGQSQSVAMGSVMLTGSASDAYVPSWAETTLTAIEAAIAGLVSKKFSTTAINGEQYTLQDLDKLRRYRVELRAEVAANQTRRGMKPVAGGPKTIKTRFGRRQ